MESVRPAPKRRTADGVDRMLPPPAERAQPGRAVACPSLIDTTPSHARLRCAGTSGAFGAKGAIGGRAIGIFGAKRVEFVAHNGPVPQNYFDERIAKSYE